MSNGSAFEKKVGINCKRNRKYIDRFEKWLVGKDLAVKTIRKHLSNVNLYINDYLNYYDEQIIENWNKK